MIIEKQPLPDNLTPIPLDAPPSYDAVAGGSSGASDRQGDSKGRILIDHPEVSTSSSSYRRPEPSSSSSSTFAYPPKSPKSPSPNFNNNGKGSISKGKGRAVSSGTTGNWFNKFNFSGTRTARDVRSTVLGLVRDLIQEQNDTPKSPVAAAAGILQSCSDACMANDVSLSAILQEKSIEGHTPLYWAIVKRVPDPDEKMEVDGDERGRDAMTGAAVDLLTALISYATPLAPETIVEVRQACIVTSDQALFQRLRLSTPEFAPVSKVEQMLLGGAIPPDEIELDLNLDADDGGGGAAFAVNLVIPQFHKRITVAKEVGIEFIARSRMWKLAFFIAPEPAYSSSDEPRKGSWCISLALLENSPPTHVQGRLIITEVRVNSKSSDSSPQAPKSPFRLPGSLSSSNSNSKRNAPKYIGLSTLEKPLEAPTRWVTLGTKVVVCLDDSVVGPNFQYGNNPYIGSDEKLRVRLEARLGKRQGTDCIIC